MHDDALEHLEDEVDRAAAALRAHVATGVAVWRGDEQPREPVRPIDAAWAAEYDQLALHRNAAEDALLKYLKRRTR